MKLQARHAARPLRTATVDDLIAHLTQSTHDMSAIASLGPGMGAAQYGIAKAVDAAAAAGLVTIVTDRRGKQYVQLVGRQQTLTRVQKAMAAIDRRRAGAKADAVDALARIGVNSDTRILSAQFVGDALIVATYQPDAWLPYAVDTFRLPTAAETDPELADDARLDPGVWVLVEQAGSHAEADVPRLVDEAAGYVRELGLDPQPTVLV